MANEGTEKLKARLREGTLNERIKRRQELYNKHRELSGNSLKKTTFKESDVIAAASTIAGNSKNKEDAFGVLKAAFMQDLSLMIAFMKVDGALHSLVGHLLSHNSYQQLLAMECCCNLSLGDTKTCNKLAKAATPYIITILQGCNYKLMNVAIQTLSNLSGSGDKTCHLLYSQGIIETFQRTIKFAELGELTAKSLVMFTKNLKTDLKEEEVRTLVHSVLPYFEASAHIQWLLYHFSSISYVIPILISKEIPVRILGQLERLQALRPENIISVTGQVRMLGNLSTDPEGVTANVILDNWAVTLRAIKLFMNSSYKHLCKELFWALGNILKHNSPEVQQKLVRRARDLQWLSLHALQRTEAVQRTVN